MPAARTRTLSRLAVLAAAALLLAACGTPTPYVPAGADSGYGYAAQKIEGNRFRVTFAGNALTSRITVENYLLYRAAEVTLAQNRDWFVVVSRAIDADTTYHTTYDGWSYYPPYRRRDPFWGPGFYPYPWGHGTSTADTRYDAHAEIVLHSGRKPADNAQAFDAREVIRNLGPAIVRLPPVGE